MSKKQFLITFIFSVILATTAGFLMVYGFSGPPAGIPPSGSGLIFATSSRVGIGTTTPSARLAVTGLAGNNPIVNFASSTNASLFFIAPSGNVGVGTTIPARRLTVASSSDISIDATGGRITNVGPPSALTDAATMAYVDAQSGSCETETSASK